MKKLIITISVLMTMSVSAQECYRAQCEDYVYNYKVDSLIWEIENNIEWLNEDLYQGKITQKYYNVIMVVFEFLLSRTLIIEKEIK